MHVQCMAYIHVPAVCIDDSEQQLLYKCKNIFTKMLKDVGMEVPKSIETRSKFSMHADKGRG